MIPQTIRSESECPQLVLLVKRNERKADMKATQMLEDEHHVIQKVAASLALMAEDLNVGRSAYRPDRLESEPSRSRTSGCRKHFCADADGPHLHARAGLEV